MYIRDVNATSISNVIKNLKPTANTKSTILRRQAIRWVISQKHNSLLINKKSLLILMSHMTNN